MAARLVAGRCHVALSSRLDKNMTTTGRKTYFVRAGRGGHVELPEDVWAALGLGENDDVRVSWDGDSVVIRRADAPEPSVGSPWIRDAIEAFAGVRERLENVPEAEINDAIDEAIREVRAERAQSRR
jgi:antitoxin component of MazEF toxin-antitoxin module